MTGEILEQVGDERAKGLLERDVGNVLAFFRRKYGLERDVGEILEQVGDEQAKGIL